MGQQKMKVVFGNAALQGTLEGIISCGHRIDFILPIELTNGAKKYIIIYE